ncbi:MAG: DUF488 domain-containing protein [Planctomycetota bacterium]|jgi:uncharacterized protein (DUF488 family)
MTNQEKTTQIFTVGHSTRPFHKFLPLLREFEINILADIRRFPSSRKFPHFNKEVLRKLLNDEGIEYMWFEALGGRRHAEQNDESPNTGLRSHAFRSYADHMATSEFYAAVQKLLSTAEISITAVMCAEKLYWKCHRRLLSDYLISRGLQVHHIIEPGKLQPHRLSPGAVITPDHAVLYPPGENAHTDSQTLFET